jgi:hypothetical protein
MIRLLRWCFFSVAFALLPLALAVFMPYLVLGERADPHRLVRGSPEMLFFCLMISATALGDLFEVSRGRWRALVYGLGVVLLLTAVLSAILYGSFLHDILMSADGRGRLDFQTRMFRLSTALAYAAAVAAGLAQCLIGAMERVRSYRLSRRRGV